MALQNITQLFSPSILNDSVPTRTLGEEFVLCENGNMVFHWSDFFETCEAIKRQLEHDPILMKDYIQREAALTRLSLIPVWVRTEKKVHQTTIYDLYEKYILNQIHLLGGIDPFCPLEISFISGTGPFKNMSISECFNKATYRDFVLTYLLKGKLPRRDYRIRLKSKILLEHGKNFAEANLVSLEQLTLNGMLFSVESETYMKKIAEEGVIRLLINTKILADGENKNLEDLKSYLSQYAFNLLYSSNKEDSLVCNLSDVLAQSGFDFSQNKRVLLFVPYEKLTASNPKAVQAIRDFVIHTKELVRNYYLKNDHEKTA